MQSTPDKSLPDVLQKRTPSVSLKSHTVSYLRHQTRSFDYTRDVLVELLRQIEAEVASLGGNEALEAILGALGVPEDGVGSPVLEMRPGLEGNLI